MNTAHFPTLPVDELRSPTGRFHSFCQNVSLALGGTRNIGAWGGGHPFDLQLRRIPPGAAVCPFHAHLAQWEFFLVRRGEGTVRAGEAGHAVKTGDAFIHPPNEAHQLINTGAGELEVFIVADNPPLDAFYYPDSNKWGLRPPNAFFTLTEASYFAGEDPAPNPPPPAPLPALIALGAARNKPVGLGGHPFEVELGQLAPGESGCPFHRHALQWEMFVILAGTASVRAEAETATLRAGDVVLQPPGTAHQIRNAGDDELRFLLIADNPPGDYWEYPDSGKWGFRAPRKFFRLSETEYYDGEE
jgi:uncharacterized cupin superfamily protein